jgi:hypothetical protein
MKMTGSGAITDGKKVRQSRRPASEKCGLSNGQASEKGPSNPASLLCSAPDSSLMAASRD